MLRIIAFIMLTPLVAFGQTVTEVSGKISNGESATIFGSSFGTKSPAAQLIFDTVESGDFSPTWYSTGGLSVSPESRHLNSSYCGTENMTGEDGTGAAYVTAPTSPVSEKWFCQYWFKLNSNFDWGTGAWPNEGANLSNVKFFRMWSPVGGDEENFHINLTGWINAARYYSENVSDLTQVTCFSGYQTAWTKDEWHCLQFQYGESTQGLSDGHFSVWLDGTLESSTDVLMTRDDEAELKRPFIIGFYDAWGDSSTDRNDFYIDDIYSDNSWARVELGNASIYASCTHREMQIPTAWATGEITVTVNTGSFSTNDSAHLFVVDSNGTASVGYPVTIGESGGGSTALQGCGTITATKAE